ncbi:MAG: hypothetical protein P8R42_24985 [Candidatus Binatia bacterium]|nr:hypothetical protein [Candidatus Binatia bacterium]
MSSDGAVYVVDDDASVRKAVGWLVESIGLETRFYSSAAEHLEAYDSS